MPSVELRPEPRAAPPARAARLARELGVVRGRARPALDPAGRLEPRDRRDEVAAGDLELRRERRARPSSNGACSVTAGLPNGQRTATRRKARGGRPSCRATISRRPCGVDRRPVLVVLAPGGDAADDEELLARLHEAEPARLADELLGRCRPWRCASQLLLLRAQRRTSAWRALQLAASCGGRCCGGFQ